MRSLEEIKRDIGALQLELETTKKNLRAEALANRVKAVYEYTVKPVDDHPLYKKLGGIVIQCKLKNQEEIERWQARYEESHLAEKTLHSQVYIWLDGMIYVESGGHSILSCSWYNQELPCTKEEWDSIKSGNIPSKFISEGFLRNSEFTPAK